MLVDQATRTALPPAPDWVETYPGLHESNEIYLQPCLLVDMDRPARFDLSLLDMYKKTIGPKYKPTSIKPWF